MAFRDRPTPELIVLSLAFTVCATILLLTLFAIGGVITGHGETVKGVLTSVAELINGLIALLVGFLVGRTNGKPPGGAPPSP